MLQSAEKWNSPVNSLNWLLQVRLRGTGLSTGEGGRKRENATFSGRLVLSLVGIQSGLSFHISVATAKNIALTRYWY